MQEETKEKVEAEIKDWTYLQELPDTCHGFKLSREKKIVESMYDIYSYIHPQLHKKAVIYYHEETREYKVRVYIWRIPRQVKKAITSPPQCFWAGTRWCSTYVRHTLPTRF